MALCREWAERIKNDLGEISKETVSFSSCKKKKYMLGVGQWNQRLRKSEMGKKLFLKITVFYY